MKSTDRSFGESAIRPLRYLYFRLYVWLFDRFGAYDYPQVSALLATTFLTALNVLSIPVLIGVVGGAALTPERFRMLVPVAGGIALLVNYLVLYRNDRYRCIADEFAGESEVVRRRRTIVVVIYVLGSFVAFYGVLMFGTIGR